MSSILVTVNKIVELLGGVKDNSTALIGLTRDVFKKLQDESQEKLELFATINETTVTSIYRFFLNPLISGETIPTLKDEDVAKAFFDSPFAAENQFREEGYDLDSIQMSQIRNFGRRLIAQSRFLAMLVHHRPLYLDLSEIGNEEAQDKNIQKQSNALKEFYLELQNSASSPNAFFAFMIDILTATRVGLTIVFAIVATLLSEGRDTSDEAVLFGFSNLVRRASNKYELKDLFDYIVKKSQKPTKAPVSERFQQTDLGVLTRLAPVLNSLERTLARLNLREVEEGRVETVLLLDQSKPSDLKPDAIVAQLVHMLNFHANYAPRLDYVVENIVLKQYQDLELSFDSSNAEADPNSSLYRAMMFIQVGMMEDWSLFCRTTGFFEVQRGEAGTNYDEVLARDSIFYLDMSFPSLLANDGLVATVYWNNAWKSIEVFMRDASKENLSSILNAFTAIQMFHAKQGLAPVTEIKNQNQVFASKRYVQDEREYNLLWRAERLKLPAEQREAGPSSSSEQADAADGQANATEQRFETETASLPVKSLLYGTVESLFRNLFVEPKPYQEDGFKPNQFVRSSMFLNPENTLLLIQTVIGSLFQLAMKANSFGNLNILTKILARRASQPYDPQNRQELPLPDIGPLLENVLQNSRLEENQRDAEEKENQGEQSRKGKEEVDANQRDAEEEENQVEIQINLFNLGYAIVDAALISSVAKNNKLVYPPAIADLCLAWLTLYTTSYVPNNQRTTYLFRFDPETTLDLLVTMSVAFEQLKALKTFLDPKERLKRKMLSYLSQITESYKKDLVDFYAKPNDQTKNQLSFAAQQLIDAIRSSEEAFGHTLPENVKMAYQQLTTGGIDAFSEVSAQIIQDYSSTVAKEIRDAQEMLLTYLDAVQLIDSVC